MATWDRFAGVHRAQKRHSKGRQKGTQKFGAPGGTRTLNLRFRRPLLYPLSYGRTKHVLF